jgi:acetylglutamate kinase
MKASTVVVKIGGRTLSASGVLDRLVSDVAGIVGTEQAYRIIIVHGGGAEVTALAERLGIVSEFADGIRMTGAEEMDAVDMVLSGLVNKRVARRFQAAGVDAVGISGSDGGTLIGEPVLRPDGRESRTARPSAGGSALLRHLLDGGYLAVVASTVMDEGGRGLNLNADDAALEIAKMLEADALLFLSDVPGVLRAAGTEHGRAAGTEAGAEERAESGATVIHDLPASAVEAEIEAETISGGMIPKTRSSVGALHAGVGTVIIGPYTEDGSLEALLAGRRGTRIHL